jgi:hypothetical protein
MSAAATGADAEPMTAWAAIADHQKATSAHRREHVTNDPVHVDTRAHVGAASKLDAVVLRRQRQH